MLVDHGRRSSALPSRFIRPAPGALVAIRRIRSARRFVRYPLLHAAAVRRLIAGFRLPCSPVLLLPLLAGRPGRFFLRTCISVVTWCRGVVLLWGRLHGSRPG
jgi:hypothetical protein